MTCREIDDISIFQGNLDGLTECAVQHLADCERCRRLQKRLEGFDVAPAPSPARLRRIQAAVLDDLKPVQPLSHPSVYLFAFGILFLGAVGLGVLGLGWHGWQALSTAQAIVVSAATAIIWALLALSLARQMSPAGKYKAAPIRLTITASALLLFMAGAAFQPRYEPAFVAAGWPCLVIGLVLALAAAIPLWLLLRRGAWLSPWLTGATAGTFAGLIGSTVLEIHCANHDLNHILTWHLGVVALCGFGGMLFGVRWRDPTDAVSGRP